MTWQDISGVMPPALPGESSFASSGDLDPSAPPVTGAIFGLGDVGQAFGVQAGDNGGRGVVVTANTGGAAWTPDEGNTWFQLPGVTGFWAVAFVSPKAGWLVGLEGRILKISF